jgi:rhamnulokinase
VTEHLAIDLGAGSGRAIRGRLDGDRLAVHEVRRFATPTVQLTDGLHWEVDRIFGAVREAIAQAPEAATVGIDTWGVDYGLIDRDGALLAPPFHYRDARAAPAIARAFARVARDELYAATGIHTLAINTIFQLVAEDPDGPLAAAEHVLLMPDLLAFWLTGRPANEITAASTTGLLDARTGRWALALIERLGLPARPFRDLVEPGAALGPVLPAHAIGRDVEVLAVAGHDTASAFAATPLAGPDAAVISSGTWSIVGMELDAPVLDPLAEALELTNERGVDGTTRLEHNVMGLWLVQECARAWDADHAELERLATDASPHTPLFDPDAPELLAPGDMPARLAAACTALGQRAPATRGALVRAILTSLACKYRLVVERLECVTGRRVGTLHVVGGGSRNRLLCRLTADIAGRPVLAGPVEASAMGNLLLQARACGELATLADLRAVVARSAPMESYEPAPERDRWEATYGRFVALTASDG